VFFGFCDRTTGAGVGTGRSSPGVVRLGPPRIAAAVIVRAGWQGAGSSSEGGAVVVSLSWPELQRWSKTRTRGDQWRDVRATGREVQCRLSFSFKFRFKFCK
jgi:hypothetical protein